MKKLIRVLLLSLCAAIPIAHASAEPGETPEPTTVTEVVPLTTKQAAESLTAAVVRIVANGRNICSATKIGPKLYLSAGHCASGLVGARISGKGYSWVGIRSFTVTTQKKVDGGKREDWVLINTVEEVEDRPALSLGCTEELYLGQAVASAGYPAPLNLVFTQGRVISLDRALDGPNALDFVTDITGAPGSSGSAVISMDTGNIIGILTEGVPSRVGFYAVGIESIHSLDICEDIIAAEKAAEEGDKPAPVLLEPSEEDEVNSPF